ncbi:MAG: deaminase [Bdellovibrionales bacterium]
MTSPLFMTKTIYDFMQAAVDIVQQSPHPTNKVAATLAIHDYAVSRTNHWPATIENTLGRDAKIGNSSGTLHAETACIFAAMRDGIATKNASLFITDPPCPNCMKNIAEAGISKLYIDHKGFDKDWARRRGEDFENMSLRIADKAGIDVFVIYRKEKRFEVISKHAANYAPSNENPPLIIPISSSCDLIAGSLADQKDPVVKPQDDGFWLKALTDTMTDNQNHPFAAALARQNGQTVFIAAPRHPTIGYTYETIEDSQKYSFFMEPLNRLLMIAAKEGVTLDPAHILSSRVPTSRELVNFIGSDHNSLFIMNTNECRDDQSQHALTALTDHHLLTIKHLSE